MDPKKHERSINFTEFPNDYFRVKLATALGGIEETSDLAVAVLGARPRPAATLVTTTGLGHRRLLRDADVIRRVVAFAASAEA